MAKKRKRKKTRPAAEVETAVKKRRGVGFGAMFSHMLRRYFAPVAAASALMAAASAVMARSDVSTPSYIAFYAAALILLAATAAVSAVNARRAITMPDKLTLWVKEKDRELVTPGTAAGALCVSAATSSAVSAAVVFLCLLALTSATLAVAGSAAFLSAAYYVSLVLAVTAADRAAIGSRRRFIRGVVVIYTAGLLALILFLACTSRIPLGDDFTGLDIPQGTLASLSILYLSATLLRSVYLYFILRRRLRTD